MNSTYLTLISNLLEFTNAGYNVVIKYYVVENGVEIVKEFKKLFNKYQTARQFIETLYDPKVSAGKILEPDLFHKKKPNV